LTSVLCIPRPISSTETVPVVSLFFSSRASMDTT
jgi:hypothetical protein